MRSPIIELVEKHDEWRSNALNLLPSENFLSMEVRKALASDLAGRYSLKMNAYVHGAWVDNVYGGTKYADEIMEITRKLAEDLFKAKYAEVRPLSGHISSEIMLLSTLKKGDYFMAISSENGGYDGYMQEYLPDMLGFNMHEIPFDKKNYNIDYDSLENLVKKMDVKLIVLGASYFPFPYDLHRIREFYHGYIGYDASHVLGLIGSGEFQPEIPDYVDIVVGSTHKSLYGPQGGIVLVYNEELIDNVKGNVIWKTLDNPHLNRIAALGQALYEMKKDASYGTRVIKSAKELARSLDSQDIPIKLKPKYTESHQILLDTEKMRWSLGLSPKDFKDKLEKNNIITDSVGRLGVAEVVHRGVEPDKMSEIADFIKRAIDGENVAEDVKSFINDEYKNIF